MNHCRFQRSEKVKQLEPARELGGGPPTGVRIRSRKGGLERLSGQNWDYVGASLPEALTPQFS
jgi:hypothetical protein